MVIKGETALGPPIFQHMLTKAVYRNTQYRFSDIPLLQTTPYMYFMHDGAASHVSIAERNTSNDKHPERWVSRGRTVA
jgi:hypothetical protein